MALFGRAPKGAPAPHGALPNGMREGGSVRGAPRNPLSRAQRRRRSHGSVVPSGSTAGLPSLPPRSSPARPPRCALRSRARAAVGGDRRPTAGDRGRAAAGDRGAAGGGGREAEARWAAAGGRGAAPGAPAPSGKSWRRDRLLLGSGGGKLREQQHREPRDGLDRWIVERIRRKEK